MPMLAMAFDNQPGSAAVLLCTAVCVVASMNDMAAPSVSLEGKNAVAAPVAACEALAGAARQS